jgi:hypothetical protein
LLPQLSVKLITNTDVINKDFKMRKFIKDFSKAEDGNVTVDWIVLISGIIFLSVAVVASIASSADTLAESTGDDIDLVASEDFVG